MSFGRAINESTTGDNSQARDVSHYVFMGSTAGQLALLEKSYARLKESVYDGLVGQWGFNGGRVQNFV